MLLSNRAIFQANANRSPPPLKFNSTSVTDSVVGVRHTDTKSYEYLIRSPYPGSYGVTATFDNNALENGFGYCGSCTFKYKEASNYVWTPGGFWSNWPGFDQLTNIDQSSAVFMFDGVFVEYFNDQTFENTGEFLPMSLAKTTTTNKLAILGEYADFAGVYFDLDFDAYANRWLTITWSWAEEGVLSNFNHETVKYGVAETWQTAFFRMCLWDAVTGELLGKTDRKTSSGLAVLTNTRTNYTWTFDHNWANYPNLDFEINNNAQSDTIKVCSVWHSIGGTVWDPLVIGVNAVGSKLPEYIGGKRAVINMTVTGVTGTEDPTVPGATDPYFLYGYRPGIAGVTNPTNAVNFFRNNINPISTDGV